MTTATAMPFAQLERVYEELALAIDKVGPANEALFLTKLAMTLAHRLGDAAVFSECVNVALQDLAGTPDQATVRI